ncbi:PAS domain-containing sensor histidine kinase [Flavobacterium sp. XGLA_31]|uniref:PAS domain-containing sensor histidine kinase n=1 Tax=Flavobacterium sp. XGLA_31 TaxID=3447666 RepID=UPI003F406A0B
MSEHTISRFDLHHVADFLPYPFIIAEVINGVHYNTFLNEKFNEEIGYTPEEIPTIQAWYEHAYPDAAYREEVIRAWDEEEINSKQEGKVFVRKKSQVTCKNGHKKWYEIKAAVVDKLHVVAFIDLDKEITLQEELKNINCNNDRMLSVLGHDLRAPISNLTDISAMALENNMSQEDFTPFIKKINKQSAQVLDLLETTLNWSKANFNTIQVSKEQFKIKAIIASVVAIYKNACADKAIEVKLAITEEATLFSDLEIVTIIARNMITNAIKFTPSHGQITISFQDNTLKVTDTGVGMTADRIKNILGNSYASERGTNNEIGMGMGMQLVQNLAEKIEAKITIESKPGQGTAVSLIF